VLVKLSCVYEIVDCVWCIFVWCILCIWL